MHKKRNIIIVAGVVVIAVLLIIKGPILRKMTYISNEDYIKLFKQKHSNVTPYRSSGVPSLDRCYLVYTTDKIKVGARAHYVVKLLCGIIKERTRLETTLYSTVSPQTYKAVGTHIVETKNIEKYLTDEELDVSSIAGYSIVEKNNGEIIKDEFGSVKIK
ncbi:hypothetical protein ACFL0T_08490 [Candidatus Omnitrophota bacterium]